MAKRTTRTQAQGLGETFNPGRLVLVLGLIAAIAVVYATGLHSYLSLESLVRHRAVLEGFIDRNYAAALALFVGVYFAVVALSIPAALFLSIAAGILFGAIVGPLASAVGATLGATAIFLIAQTAFGEHLVRRAGPAMKKFAAGFREDAFNYLLFLRLVPLFPFWMVNIAPALFGVSLGAFVGATAIGVLPGAFAFGFFGAGLDSAIGAQAAAFRECLAAGKPNCQLSFDLRDAATPQLIGAFAVLGIIALIPVVVKRWRARRHAAG